MIYEGGDGSVKFASDGGREIDGSEFDDDNGPAALPVTYEGKQPTQPEPMLEIHSGPAIAPQPILVDSAPAPSGGGGVTINAPKVPESLGVAVVPSSVTTPVLRADQEVTVRRTIFDTRLVWLGLVFLIIAIAANYLQENSGAKNS